MLAVWCGIKWLEPMSLNDARSITSISQRIICIFTNINNSKKGNKKKKKRKGEEVYRHGHIWRNKTHPDRHRRPSNLSVRKQAGSNNEAVAPNKWHKSATTVQWLMLIWNPSLTSNRGHHKVFHPRFTMPRSNLNVYRVFIVAMIVNVVYTSIFILRHNNRFVSNIS